MIVTEVLQPGWNLTANWALWRSELAFPQGRLDKHWLALDSFQITFRRCTKPTALCTHLPSTPAPWRSTLHPPRTGVGYWQPHGGEQQSTKHLALRGKALSYAYVSGDSSFPAWLSQCQLLLCRAAHLTPGTQDLLSFTKITHAAHPACAWEEIFHSVGFVRAIFQFAQQINDLIQRAFKPAERLLISTGSGSSGQQGTEAFIISLWAKNRVEHMTRFSPQARSHHPPASTGHGFVATGWCLPPGPVDTGQSSRKPSKSWG